MLAAVIFGNPIHYVIYYEKHPLHGSVPEICFTMMHYKLYKLTSDLKTCIFLSLVYRAVEYSHKSAFSFSNVQHNFFQ